MLHFTTPDGRQELERRLCQIEGDRGVSRRFPVPLRSLNSTEASGISLLVASSD